MTHSSPVQRLRLTYSKTGEARYIGHLDLARFWERVFRRVGLPLAYSHGFHPQPRIQFASALPVGVEGEQELLDLWLTQRVEPQAWQAPIARNLPPGFALLDLREVDLKAPAMQAVLRQAVYRVCWQDVDNATLQARVDALLAQETIPRPRFKKPHKTYDLRPRILAMQVLPEQPGCVRMWLQAGSQGHARVNEVIEVLGLAEWPQRVVREHLIFE